MITWWNIPSITKIIGSYGPNPDPEHCLPLVVFQLQPFCRCQGQLGQVSWDGLAPRSSRWHAWHDRTVGVVRSRRARQWQPGKKTGRLRYVRVSSAHLPQVLWKQVQAAMHCTIFIFTSLHHGPSLLFCFFIWSRLSFEPAAAVQWGWLLVQKRQRS